MENEFMDTASVYDQLEDYLKAQISSGNTHEVIDPAVLEEFFMDTSVLKQKSSLYSEQITENSEQRVDDREQITEANVSLTVSPEAVLEPVVKAPENPTHEPVKIEIAEPSILPAEADNSEQLTVNNEQVVEPVRVPGADVTLAELHKSLQKEPVQQTLGFCETARVMFLGEYSKLNPDPFSGKTGETLSKMIKAMRLDLEGIYMARVDKSTDQAYQAQQIATLTHMIQQVQPEAIVILGAVPAKLLMKVESLMRSRGQWLDFNGIPVMPTFSPQYLERNPASKRETWSDLQQVMTKLAL